MRVLFDKSAPNKLIPHLEGHAISTAEEQGWGRLENGELLQAAEDAGFDLFFTADKNIRYQQNLTGRKIALVVLGNSAWPLVRLHIPEIVEAINAAKPGSYVEIKSRYLRRSPSPSSIDSLLVRNHVPTNAFRYVAS